MRSRSRSGFDDIPFGLAAYSTGAAPAVARAVAKRVKAGYETGSACVDRRR